MTSLIFKSDLLTIVKKNNDSEFDDGYSHFFYVSNNKWAKKYIQYLLVNTSDVAFSLNDNLISYEYKTYNDVKNDYDERNIPSNHKSGLHIFEFSGFSLLQPIQSWKKNKSDKLHYDELEQYIKDIGFFINMIEINENKSIPSIDIKNIFVLERNDDINNTITTRFIPLFLGSQYTWFTIQQQINETNRNYYHNIQEIKGFDINKRNMIIPLHNNQNKQNISDLDDDIIDSLVKTIDEDDSKLDMERNEDDTDVDDDFVSKNKISGFTLFLSPELISFYNKIQINDKINSINDTNVKLIDYIYDDSDDNNDVYYLNCASWIYSLGISTIYLFSHNKQITSHKNKGLEYKYLRELIDPILHTPLYHCILRTIKQNINQRCFLWI